MYCLAKHMDLTALAGQDKAVVSLIPTRLQLPMSVPDGLKLEPAFIWNRTLSVCVQAFS